MSAPDRSEQTGSGQLSASDSRNRQRQWATKSKKGCRTCRHRRIKCDEAKPSCNRCIASRVVCTYDSLVPRRQANIPAALTGCFVLQNSPAWNSASTEDMELFGYFRNNVAGQLAGSFHLDFWTSYVPQNAQEQPAIWHACIAMAATQRRFLTCAESERQLDTTIMQHYGKSIGHLKEISQKLDISPAVQEQILITNALLIALACSLGRKSEAHIHAASGLDILRQWRRRRWVRQGQSGVIPPADSLLTMYVRLDDMVKGGRKSSPALVPPPAPMEKFATAAEAYYELMTIYHGLAEEVPVSDLRFRPLPAAGLEFRHAFQVWKKTFMQFKESALPREQDSILGLELQATLVEIRSRLNIFSPHIEMEFDPFLPEFEKIIKTVAVHHEKQVAGRVQQPHRICSKFSFCPSVSETLYFVARGCRHPRIRRRAIALLEDTERRDSSLDTRLFPKMAKVIVQVEERNWGAATGCHCKANEYICNDHRVAETQLTYPAPGKAEYGVWTVLHTRDNLPMEIFHMCTD